MQLMPTQYLVGSLDLVMISTGPSTEQAIADPNRNKKLKSVDFKECMEFEFMVFYPIVLFMRQRAACTRSVTRSVWFIATHLAHSKNLRRNRFVYNSTRRSKSTIGNSAIKDKNCKKSYMDT